MDQCDIYNKMSEHCYSSDTKRRRPFPQRRMPTVTVTCMILKIITLLTMNNNINAVMSSVFCCCFT